jgi:hypothetical protein
MSLKTKLKKVISVSPVIIATAENAGLDLEALLRLSDSKGAKNKLLRAVISGLLSEVQPNHSSLGSLLTKVEKSSPSSPVKGTAP